MHIRDKVVVVTGGASGIGAALVKRFRDEGAAGVVAADLQEPAVGAADLFVRTDVSGEADVQALVRQAEEAFGRVDLFCSNAGIGGGGGIEAPDELWEQTFKVNLMAHVYAARAVLPGMLARGDGYLLNTASAAGLLTNLGNATYTVTKHGAVAFAEFLAITYGDQGIKVSCLCPQGVRTPMLVGGLDQDDPAAKMVLASGGMIEPEDVAQAVVDGLADERFLILPHPEVADYYRRKADDPDRWLRGMRRIQAQL
ncbi:MAG TPA: SDR family oxidoreductase [Acidimicrobiales bacterium]|nr:SDR family oxidoreductase [Acidimicrobiales bacterium]